MYKEISDRGLPAAGTLHCSLHVFISCICRPLQKGCVDCFDSYVAIGMFIYALLAKLPCSDD
jgi:hypothetical protein